MAVYLWAEREREPFNIIIIRLYMVIMMNEDFYGDELIA
jgi:hypothetical protein